jgi:F-type H+-transporting ATPase subunit b
MNALKTRTRCLRLLIFWILCFWLLNPAISGAAEAGDWRPTYDLVMRWLNFLILVFVIVKFSRRPLANFLKGKQEEIGAEISRFEQEKEDIAQAAATARQKLEESARRLETIKQRIIDRGEKRKLAIIAEAREEGRHIMESARRKVEGTMLQAKNRIRQEMIDRAVMIALEKLPAEITAKDNENLFEQFLVSADGK